MSAAASIPIQVNAHVEPDLTPPTFRSYLKRPPGMTPEQKFRQRCRWLANEDSRRKKEEREAAMYGSENEDEVEDD